MEKQEKRLHQFVIGIGAVAVIVGILSFLFSDDLTHAYLPLFSGITLIGVAYINKGREEKKS